MNIDLFKYIMKLLVIPMMLISLVLITHGSDDTISEINILGFALLIVSGAIIIDNASKDEESR